MISRHSMTKCQSFGAGILFVVICVDGFLKRSAKISRFFGDDEQKGIILMKNKDHHRINENIMIRPLADRVVIEPKAAETQTASGLYIPDTAKEKPQQGTVVAAGPGKKDEPMEVKVGDVVIYGKYSGTEVSVDGKDYLIMKQSDILAIL